MNFNSPWSTFAGTNYTSPFPPFTSVSYKPPTNSTFAGPTSLLQSFDRNFKLGITESWNISIEQQLNATMVARLAYVGSESYHQTDAIDQNAATNDLRPYSNFSQILADFSITGPRATRFKD